MTPLLMARGTLRDQFTELHRKVLLLARDHGVCRRLMTIPGVGPVGDGSEGEVQSGILQDWQHAALLIYLQCVQRLVAAIEIECLDCAWWR